MAYLTINGVDAKTLASGASKDDLLVGAGIARAQDGTARNNFNAKKWTVKGKTAPLAQLDALFLEAMLDGLGDHWPFNVDAYSDKGSAWSGAGSPTPPTMPTGVSIIGSSPSPKRGSGCLQIAASSSDFITFNVDPLRDGWTVAVWLSVGAATWNHYVISGSSTVASGGACGVWLNGVAQTGSCPAWLSVDIGAGTVKLVGVTGSVQAFDDLVVVAAMASASVATQLDAFANAQAWGTWPTCYCAGDFHPSALSMLGNPGTHDVTPVSSSTGFMNNAVELEYELQEV